MNRNILAALALVVTSYVGVGLVAQHELLGEEEAEQAPHHPRQAPERRIDEPYVLVVDARVEQLASYVLAKMNEWEPAPVALPALGSDELEDVARAVAEVSVERGSTDPSQDAVLLATLGYWEGARWASYVDQGLCNDPTWRASPEGVETMRRWGTCDNGQAFTPWQIHPIVDTSSPLWPTCSKDAVTGSHVGAARCALEIASRSMDAYGSLAGYTGEPPSGSHPAADKRLAWARKAASR